MTYRADIDGLRAIAILLVLVFHFDLFAIGKAGFIGVDVFFVISGFLITSIIVEDLERGRFRFGDFLYRRIRRLYPALLATLCLTLVAGYFLFLPGQLLELATETVYSLLYVVNIYFWQNINYFGLQAGSVPLLHMWSLAVEEQFYFFFPLFCLLVYRLLPGYMLIIIAAAAVASFLLGLVATPLKPEAAFYLLPTRAWELLIGAVLACAVRQRHPGGAWLWLMGPVGLGLILFAVVIHTPVTAVPGWFVLLPTLGATAVILGGFASAAPVTRLLATAPMVWVGKISYPLYLVHWPIQIYLREHTLDLTFGWRLAGFLTSFALATLIYAAIETPVRKRRVLVRPLAYLGTVLSVTVAMLAVSAIVLRTDGLAGRYSPEVLQILASASDMPTTYSDCIYTGGGLERTCPLGDPKAETSVLVVGDSHARALAGALDIWLAGQSKRGALAFQHGCMPVLRSGGPKCPSFTAKVFDLATSTAGIEEVILVSFWRQAVADDASGRIMDGQWVPTAEVAAAFAERLSETVALLRAAGKRVTIIEPLFGAARNVPRTMAANLAFDRDWPVGIARSTHEEIYKTLFEAFDSVAGPDLRRVSLIDDFCGSGFCQPIVEGRPLYSDGNHLAFSHSAMMARILARETQP